MWKTLRKKGSRRAAFFRSFSPGEAGQFSSKVTMTSAVTESRPSSRFSLSVRVPSSSARTVTAPLVSSWTDSTLPSVRPSAAAIFSADWRALSTAASSAWP